MPKRFARVKVEIASGRVAAWDAGAEELFGWRADEAIGEPWFALVGSEATQRADRWRRLERDGAIHEVITYAGKHGPVSVMARAVAENGLIVARFEPLGRRPAPPAIDTPDRVLGLATPPGGWVRGRVRTDPFSGILEWDAGAELIFGWRADEALEETWHALIGLAPAERYTRRRRLEHDGELAGVFPFVGKHGPVVVATNIVEVSGGFEATLAHELGHYLINDRRLFPSLLAASDATRVALLNSLNGARRATLPQMPDETPRERRKRIIGENIRQFREAKNLSKGALARRLEVDRTQLIRWEAGTWEPNPDHLEALAAALEVPVHAFYVEAEAA
jgi:PAS domain-containing protein/DNA-binding XRE family transcriptional regulator